MLAFAVSSVLSNEIWFVLGMLLSMTGIKETIERKWRLLGLLLLLAFVSGSLAVYTMRINSNIVGFSLGFLACIAIILMMYNRENHSNVPEFFARFTMPIFLMHTIFAASLRTVLLKLHVDNLLIHIVLGISVSFIGPIAAATVIKKLWKLDFILYPGKYIRNEKT